MDIKIYVGWFKITLLFSFLIIVILFNFQGCAANNISSKSSGVDKPEWILNPSVNGVIGGVGYCAAHVNGIAGQKKLATERALEDIARQMTVNVNSVMVVSSKSSKNEKIPNTKIHTDSVITSKKNVKAYIKEIWVHPVTKEMYIYMIAE